MKSDSNCLGPLIAELDSAKAVEIQAVFSSLRSSSVLGEALLARAAIYISEPAVRLSWLMRGEEDESECLVGLSSLVLEFAPSKSEVLSRQIEEFHSSKDQYRAFQANWLELDLQDKKNHAGELSVLKDFAWTLLILSNQTFEEVTSFVLAHLPSSIKCLSQPNTINCDVLMQKMQDMQLRANSSGSLDGVISSCHIRHNLEVIKKLYKQGLTPEAFDKTEFIWKKHTPSKKTKSFKSGKMESKRIITWDNEQLNQNLSSMKMALLSPVKCPDTPISLALEMTSWLKTATESVQVDTSSIPHLVQKVGTLMDQMSSEYVLKLYTLAQRNAENSCSALACAIESIRFVQSLEIPLQTVLGTCGVNLIDFWRAVGPFMNFDAKFPAPLKRHFMLVESKILSDLAWNAESNIMDLLVESLEEFIPDIPDETENSPANEQPLDPVLSSFFNRVFAYTAHKVLEIAQLLELSSDLSEIAWDALKFIFNEHIEMLRFRHVDTFVLSAIYAACKLSSPISFKTVISHYAEVYPDNKEVYSNISPSGENIIWFYNSVFVPTIKDFLAGARRRTRPAVVNPTSPLRANLTNNIYSPLSSPGLRNSPRSPYMTPRTRKLCANKDSPFLMIPQVTNPTSGRLIVFDDQTNK